MNVSVINFDIIMTHYVTNKDNLQNCFTVMNESLSDHTHGTITVIDVAYKTCQEKNVSLQVSVHVF